jgi:hypothetical protein
MNADAELVVKVNDLVLGRLEVAQKLKDIRVGDPASQSQK